MEGWLGNAIWTISTSSLRPSLATMRFEVKLFKKLRMRTILNGAFSVDEELAVAAAAANMLIRKLGVPFKGGLVECTNKYRLHYYP